MSAPGTLVVAVLTFRRPDDLAALLPLLDREVAELTATGWAVSVLVVDNDPAGTGLDVVGARAEPGAVRAVVEPRPGISAGRNRALDEAGEADLLVFLDDDERPDPGWLVALVDTHRSTGAPAVAGTVRSEFARPLDPWLTAGDFFRRRRLPTSTPIHVAATNNLLLHLPTVRAAGLRFDERFGLSGGEDTLFTRQLDRFAGPLAWCAEAVVTDVVPVDRLTRRWVLQRAYSSGNSVTRVDLALASGGPGRARVVLRGAGLGLVRLGGGAARAVLGTVLRSAAHQARGLRTAARGAGMLAGLAGHSYAEYGPATEPRRRPTASR